MAQTVEKITYTATAEQVEQMHAAFSLVVRDAELETMETEAFEPMQEEIILIEP